MSKITFFFVFLSFVLVACGDPCEKAYKKTVECAKGATAKKSLESSKEVIIKLCRPFEDKVKKCLKISDCNKFNFCMIEATPTLREKDPRKPGEKDTGKDNSPEKKKIPEKKKAFDKDNF
ncbi:MAG: hypothetical protein JXR95_13855 [Deltaproteobacteria bacterium]|nr:hypothetical protein [Deltaproteobacteria bacterium]